MYMGCCVESLTTPMIFVPGMDVARKVVILARECGMSIEPKDVAVQSLIPEPLQSTSSVLEFMERLPEVGW